MNAIYPVPKAPAPVAHPLNAWSYPTPLMPSLITSNPSPCLSSWISKAKSVHISPDPHGPS